MANVTTMTRSETKRVPFTVKTLAGVTIETGKPDAWIFDAKTPALGYRLTANGVGAFYIFRRLNGKPIKYRLAGYPDVSIEQARTLAAQANALIAAGVDPREQRRQDRADTATLGQLVEHFIQTHSKLHKKSWADDEAMKRLHLKEWDDRRLSTVGQEDVRSLHAKIGKDNGKYAANRVLSLLHAAYEHGKSIWQGSNPATGVSKFKEKSRDRFLSAEELPRFFQALAQEPHETVRDYLLMLLLVGARRSNTAAMRWAELDLARGVWRIAENKSGTPIIAPLCAEAIQILNHRKKSATGEWVFPTVSDSKRSKSGHLVEFRTTWKAILKRAEIKDFRLHDLRRTLGSWLTINGASLPIVGAVLGHKSQAATAVYARLSVTPQHLAINSATNTMNVPAGLLPAPEGKGSSNGK
jgi:integrase